MKIKVISSCYEEDLQRERTMKAQTSNNTLKVHI